MKGDFGEYKSGEHVGLLTGATRMQGGQEYVQILAGNERDRELTAQGLAGAGRSQVGQVGEHWMLASELNIRRAAQARNMRAWAVWAAWAPGASRHNKRRHVTLRQGHWR
jgi:hypothetical protein